MDRFPLALHLPLFVRGAGGAPSSTPLGVDLAANLRRYEHSISDAIGFESAAVEVGATIAQAITALQTWLGCGLIASGPDAETLCEGFVAAVAADFGAETRSVSLDGMCNRVTVKYTSASGAAATSPADHANSQAIYGVRVGTQAFEATDATDAANKAARILTELAWPRMERSSQAGSGDGGDGGATIRVSVAGWASALDWLTTSSTTAATAATDTQIKSLLTSYQATNAFLSTNQGGIASTGVSSPQTIASDTTYRKAIDDRVASGNSSGDPLAFGVYEDRMAQLVTAASATPGTVTYRRAIGDGRIFDAAGNIVPWWRVRPNAIYEVVDLLDPAALSDMPDAAARGYVARVTFSADQGSMRLTLEGPQGQTIDSILARVR